MALIKKQTEKKVKMVEKTVSLSDELWKKLNAYAKYAAISGKPAEKNSYIIGEALKNVFEADKDFVKLQEAKPVEAAAEAKAENFKRSFINGC